jgi:hypothetical protein
MSAKFASATLVAAGTPQCLNTVSPTLPAQIIQGVTYPGGSATERARQVTLQADPSNTGTNIYIGSNAMVKATRAGVGLVLAKTAAPVTLQAESASIALDDIFWDGDDTGDKVLISVVG